MKTYESIDEKGWIFVPAFMMIGMGVGFLLGNVAIGLFIGMGTGFLAKGLISIFKSENKSNEL